MENLTVAEKQSMEELRKRTIDELTPRLLEDESLFYRFLKARDFNLKKAEAMLRKHLLDRKIYQIDEIANGNYVPPKHISTVWAASFVGYDKEGSVVRYLDVGGMDVKGAVSAFSFKQYILYIISYLEKDEDRLKEKSKELGRPVTNVCYILNMDKLNLYKATYKKVFDLLLEGFKFYQDNYPERVKSAYVINASIYSNMAFSILKSVLANGLIQKIQFFGSDDWKEVLLGIVDAEVLPAFLGGNRTDPDGNPMCESFIVHGKLVPTEWYAKKNKRPLCHEKGVKQMTVNRFSCSEILLDVFEPNTRIEWEFETRTRDIGFGIYYKSSNEDSSKLEELIPIQRIDTELASETGVINCNKAGKHIVVFDNTYSWIYSKELYYRISLIRPQNQL